MTDSPAARSACVVAGASPDQVRALAGDLPVELRANRLGTLVTGRPDGLPIDCAAELPGPVYEFLSRAHRLVRRHDLPRARPAVALG